MSVGECIDANDLVNFLKGKLTEEASRISRHADQCDRCRSLLVEAARAEGGSGNEETLEKPSEEGEEELRRGTNIGRYVVLDRAGAGAMGVVYSAYDPELNRRLAIKVLRGGQWAPSHTTEELHARLLREAQALARLSHPNVLSVYDVGRWQNRVFIGMEFVEGATLRDWLAQQPRRWREVVDTFLKAGEGLAAAHKAGLVHRDFKPENILVGEDGRVRVTDFGLARFVAELVHEPGLGIHPSSVDPSALRASLTNSQFIIGTPAYMAPEQLAGMQATSQSDQFSFCVSLYEALYGERPFVGHSRAELQAHIERNEIAPPSKKTLVPAWLHQVVMRGLSAKPQDRYPSMAALVSLLQADPDSVHRRNLVLAGIATVILGATLSVYAYARHLTRSCDQADAALIGVWDNDIKSTIQRAFLATNKPFARDAWEQTARHLNDYAAQWVRQRSLACQAAQQKAELPDITVLRSVCLDQRLAQLRATTKAMLQADANLTTSAVQLSENLSPLAECDNPSTLSFSFQVPPDPALKSQVERLRSHLDEAEIQKRSGQYQQGVVVASSAVDEARRLGYRPALVDALLVQGNLQNRSGDPRAAEKSYREALRIALEQGYEGGAAKATTSLVWVVGRENGRYEEAHLLADQAAGHIARLGGDALLTADLAAFEGTIYAEQAQYDKAMDLLSKALAIKKKMLGSDHTQVAETIGNIAFVLHKLNRYSEAMEHYQQSIEIMMRVLGPKHPLVGMSLGNLGAWYLDLQRFDESSRYLKHSLNVLEETVGAEHVRVAYPLLNLGSVALLEGRYLEGTSYIERSLKIFEKSLGPENPKVAKPLDLLGTISLNQGRYEDATRYYQRELALSEKSGGPEHPGVIEPLLGFASVYREQRKYSNALRMLDRARAVATKGLPPDHESAGSIADEYGQAWLAMGQALRAIPEFQQALRISEKILPGDAPQVGDRLAHLGAAYLSIGNPKAALPLLERANQIAASARLDARKLAFRQFALAQALWLNKRDVKRAIELAGQADQALARSQLPSPQERKDIVAWLRAHQVRLTHPSPL